MATDRSVCPDCGDRLVPEPSEECEECSGNGTIAWDIFRAFDHLKRTVPAGRSGGLRTTVLALVAVVVATTVLAAVSTGLVPTAFDGAGAGPGAAEGGVANRTGVVANGSNATPGSAADTVDTDGDGLSDRRERRLGLNASNPDTDGDNLPDGFEVGVGNHLDLPGTDPAHKDLFVYVYQARGTRELSAAEREQLRQVWARMPVSNPDGDRGVDLHVLGAERVQDEVHVQAPITRERFGALRQRFSPRWFGCTTHTVVLVTRYEGTTAGHAETPGLFSVAAGRLQVVGGNSTRITLLTHELLHNVVGPLDSGDAHTTAGWLSYSGGRFLSDQAATELNRDGFERAERWGGFGC